MTPGAEPSQSPPSSPAPLRPVGVGPGARPYALRPAQAAELPLLAAWLPGAQKVTEGDCQVLALAEPSHRALGLLGYALVLPRKDQGWPPAPVEGRGWLTIRFLVIAPEERGRGLGTEAVLLLEEEARRRGLARRFAAPVPLAEGLALYFWLRLGYRPLGAARGHLWMVRSEMPRHIGAEERDEGGL